MQAEMSWCCFNVPLLGKEAISNSQQLQGSFQRSNIRLFSYNELIRATNNFHPSNRIGRGGFGTVYKGTLKDGTVVAAKVLCAWSRQGANEFLTEIDTITNIRHPNLVVLLGCCMQGDNRILVYEFVENGSLDRVLLGRDGESTFDWSKRSAILIGTAKGLTFLHEEVKPHIVHRDIKASNVLLDSNFSPKIGDFGLAKLFPDNITHISTRVAGTTGYLAPEYALGGRLTKKADIYSFGVLILEIVSGRRVSKPAYPRGEKFLLEQAWQLYEENRLVDLVDPKLREYPEEEVIKFIKVALFCIQGAASRRPSTPEVLEMLSHQVRLNEKELTPPDLLYSTCNISEDSKVTCNISEDSKVTDSSYLDNKGLSLDTTILPNSASVSMSEIIPR